MRFDGAKSDEKENYTNKKFEICCTQLHFFFLK